MHWLNVVGLVLNTLAAVVMLIYPPQVSVRLHTPKGEAVFTLTGNATEEGRRIGRLQQWMSRAGLALLVAGFLCQLIAAIGDAVLA
jgi:hypothetical protein